MDLQDVNIESIGGNSNLSEWASEKTQELMLTALDSLHKTIKADNKKIIAELIKSKGTGKADRLSKTDKSKKTEVAESEKATEAKKEETKETNNYISALKKKHKGVWLATTALSGLANVAGRYAGMFSKTFGEFDTLVKHGVMDSMDGSITMGQGLANLMSVSNANLSALAETFKENSRAIKIYGAQPFVETVSAMRESLYSFGMTSNDAVKFIGKNLEQQRKLGFLNRLEGQQQAAYLNMSTSALFKFSKALGMSYEDLLQEAQTATAGADFEMFLRTLGSGAEKVKYSADVITYGLGSSVGTVITEMATLRDGTQGMSAAFATMHERGLGPLANEMWDLSRQVRAGTITEKNANKQLNRIFQTAKGYNSEELFTMLRSVSTVLGVSANEMFADLSGIAQRSEAFDKVEWEKIKNGNEQIAEAKRVQDRWNNMFVQLQAAVVNTFDKILDPDGNSVLLDRIVGLFDWIANKIASPAFTQGLEDFIVNLVSAAEWLATKLPPALEKIDNFFTKLDKFLEDLTIQLSDLSGGQLAGIAAGILGAGYVLKKSLDFLVNSIKNAAARIFSPGSPKTNTPGPTVKKGFLSRTANFATRAALPIAATYGAYKIGELGYVAYQLEKTNTALLESKESAAIQAVETKKMLDDINRVLGTSFKSIAEAADARDSGKINFDIDNSGQVIKLDTVVPANRSNFRFYDAVEQSGANAITNGIISDLSNINPFNADNNKLNQISTPTAKEKYESEKEIKKAEEPAKAKESTPVENTINKDSTVSKLQELIDIQATQLAILQTQLRVMRNGLSGDGQYNYS